MKFSVGEIAIVALPESSTHSRWNGREVTITSAPCPHEDGSLVHEVDADWLPALSHPYLAWSIEPRFLRKRRPPPDWNALAGVKTKPREREPA